MSRRGHARREKDKSHKKDTGIAPPWDAYGAPSGRRICSGDATGRRISAAAGGGRLRCGHSLPASAQIRPAGESPTSLLCLWIGLEPPAAAGRTSRRRRLNKVIGEW
ncbi:hypothetical protein HU200_001048 [Digitaria exilis]|uniref:Uncharacterized protein n=1 Tax=Digitaria exilis TaxID=1010633 RepID=A0A835KVB1_9POAL|nr:hypothetical protein HU200_001048 [Digitaria exilis]